MKKQLQNQVSMLIVSVCAACFLAMCSTPAPVPTETTLPGSENTAQVQSLEDIPVYYIQATGTPCPFISTENFEMPIGGSLCSTLHMTRQEALAFANASGMRHWNKKGTLFVLTLPGDCFTKTPSGWKKI